MAENMNGQEQKQPDSMAESNGNHNISDPLPEINNIPDPLPKTTNTPPLPNSSLSRKKKQIILAKEPLRAESQPNEIDATARKRRLRRRWCCMSCGAVTVAVVVVVVVVVVLLIKAKDPRITVTSMSIVGIQTRLDIPNLKVYINLTIDAGIAIKNPNTLASFKHGNGTAIILYHGENVGEAAIPAGTIKADKTVNMNVTANVFLDQLVNSVSSLLTDGIAGSLDVTGRTVIAGRVKVLGFIKKHITARADCGVTVNLTDRTITVGKCSRKITL